MQLNLESISMSISKREREVKRTVANLRGLFLFFVKYFNHLEKDFDTTQVAIKVLKNQYVLTRQRI